MQEPKKYVRISYILSKKEWEDLCKAHYTPMTVMDLLNIRPRAFEVKEVVRHPEIPGGELD